MAGAAAFFVLSLAGAGTYYYIKTRASQDVAAQAGSAARAGSAALSLSKGGSPTSWKVKFVGLPAGAEVYVDGVLHPERPVRLQNKGLPHELRVEAGGYETWEKEVAVYSDISLDVALARAEAAVEEVEKTPAKKGGKKKQKQSEQTSRIDTEYPGLK
jgi:hypothetical protein